MNRKFEILAIGRDKYSVIEHRGVVVHRGSYDDALAFYRRAMKKAGQCYKCGNKLKKGDGDICAICAD